MRHPKEPLIAAAMLIVVGAGALVNSLAILPRVDWVWTLGLAAGGVLIPVFVGLTRTSFVLGAALLVGAVLSFFRQIQWLGVQQEVPMLLIAVGVLILVSHLLPAPRHPL
jgi:hypothetical protein